MELNENGLYLITAKIVYIAMQNTEGQGRYPERLGGKGKSTNHYKVQCVAQSGTGTK